MGQVANLEVMDHGSDENGKLVHCVQAARGRHFGTGQHDMRSLHSIRGCTEMWSGNIAGRRQRHSYHRVSSREQFNCG